jgi:hypothetical protein
MAVPTSMTPPLPTPPPHSNNLGEETSFPKLPEFSNVIANQFVTLNKFRIDREINATKYGILERLKAHQPTDLDQLSEEERRYWDKVNSSRLNLAKKLEFSKTQLKTRETQTLTNMSECGQKMLRYLWEDYKSRNIEKQAMDAAGLTKEEIRQVIQETTERLFQSESLKTSSRQTNVSNQELLKQLESAKSEAHSAKLEARAAKAEIDNLKSKIQKSEELLNSTSEGIKNLKSMVTKFREDFDTRSKDEDEDFGAKPGSKKRKLDEMVADHKKAVRADLGKQVSY